MALRFAMMMGMPTLKRADVPLHYAREGAGTPVLFIQGVGVAGEGWRPQVDAFKGSYDTLVFDNRGHNKSIPCTGPITIEAMAEDALALMDAAGWQSAHVVGHSMGGLIAQELALSHPERVRSLALLCTLHRGPAGARVSPTIAWLGIRTRVGTRKMRRRAFLELVYPKSYRAKVDPDEAAAHLGALAGRDLADSPPILMKQLNAMRGHDKFDQLGKLAGIPTLVAAAEEDPIALPEFGELLAKAIPGARYVFWDDASHAITINDAPRVNKALVEFWQTVPTPSAA